MFRYCYQLSTVSECFMNDTTPTNFHFRLSSPEKRYFYHEYNGEIIISYTGEFYNFKNVQQNLVAYALFRNAGIIVSKINQISENVYSGEYSGIPSQFFKLGGSAKIKNMAYCFSGLYSLHNIIPHNTATVSYYSNPIFDYSQSPKDSSNINKLVWNYKDLETEKNKSSTSFICRNPSANTSEIVNNNDNSYYNPYIFTWNRYAWDGLYKKELDLLLPDNFIEEYSGDLNYASYYGELYPIGKKAGDRTTSSI